jgi:hypothetical protein
VRPNRLLTSSTFRYALVYVAMFGVSVVGILAFVYWEAVAVVSGQTDDTIRNEIASLAEHYQQRGLGQLISVIAERSGNRFGHRGIYLLADPDYRPLAGNIDAWPTVARGEPGWVDFLIGTEPAAPAPPPASPAPTPSCCRAASACWSDATPPRRNRASQPDHRGPARRAGADHRCWPSSAAS